VSKIQEWRGRWVEEWGATWDVPEVVGRKTVIVERRESEG
jgi:hypothetical protein